MVSRHAEDAPSRIHPIEGRRSAGPCSSVSPSSPDFDTLRRAKGSLIFPRYTFEIEKERGMTLVKVETANLPTFLYSTQKPGSAQYSSE